MLRFLHIERKRSDEKSKFPETLQRIPDMLRGISEKKPNMASERCTEQIHICKV